MSRYLLCAALLLPVLAGCATSRDSLGAAAPAASSSDLITARRAGMHMTATLLFRSIKAAVSRGTDVKEQVAAADGLARWAAAIPGLFPPGSNIGDTRARPEIWANKADFDRRAAEFGSASARLAALAEAGDAKGFAAQVEVVQRTCGGCHAPYRSD